MTNKSNIKLSTLRKIVKEELMLVSEDAKNQATHAAKAAVSGAASKLLGAIDDFQESATPAVVSAIAGSLEPLVKLLDHMNDVPGAYIATVKPQPKKVTLRAVKEEHGRSRSVSQTTSSDMIESDSMFTPDDDDVENAHNAEYGLDSLKVFFTGEDRAAYDVVMNRLRKIQSGQ